MPTIRRIFLILLTFVAVFTGGVYALAYLVRPKIAELTITIPNDKLNLRPLATQPNETITVPQSVDDEVDEPDDSLR